MLARLLLVAFGLLPLSAAAQAYRWVDEKGQVHYSQTPPPGKNAQPIAPPPPAAAAPNQEALNRSLADEKESEPEKRAAAERINEAHAQREQQCRQAREQLAYMDANPPIRMTTTDDKGNVSRVTDEQHRARRAELADAVAQHCS